MILIIYQGKEFKAYDDFYYVSKDGEVFSTYKNGLLKHAIDHDGYHRVDIHGKHIKIHKLVYLVWYGDIPDGLQVNHFDDDKNNNSFDNLYLGTQADNIADCIRNDHRVGNKQSIVVYDKETQTTTTYESVKSFLDTTGHSARNGSISKVMKRNWFNKRYEVLERKGVTTIESYIPT